MDVTAEEAGEHLADYLLHLNDLGKMNAKVLCIVAYWASKAGAVGTVSRLAFAPGKSSDGAYQRHLDSVLQVESELEGKLYELAIPGHDKFDMSRSSHMVSTMPAHEVLFDEYVEHPELAARLEDMLASDEVPPPYHTHPVVLRHLRSEVPTFPLALYMDGVSCTKAETVLNITVQSLASGRRHLLAVVRKSRMCRCGCAGWCSTYPVMRWLHWCFSSLASGQFPRERHDGKPWRATDALRAARGGTPLPFVGALCEIRGDWAEYAHTFGLPTWSSADHPCFFCKGSLVTCLGLLRSSRPGDLPWELKTHEDYESSCTACEQTLALPRADWDKVRAALYYDKRKAGARGKALMYAIPELSLEKDDRLEPHASLEDVAGFELCTAWPMRAVFWRRSREAGVRRRNPLFDPAIGITHELFRVDTLHTLALGVYKTYVHAATWALLGSEIYSHGPIYSAAEKHQLNAQRLRYELWAFYDASLPTASRVPDFRVEMFGARGSNQVHAKRGADKGPAGIRGGEARWLR